MDKFEEDLTLLVERLGRDVNEETHRRLEGLKEGLVHLRSEKVVKINHSVMELVCAKYLILSGYEVKVEHFINNLSCDLYAKKGLGHLIVEVETGYVPPEHALNPSIYSKSRIVSKISRYSSYVDKFSLGTPPHNILPIHPALIKPPRYRTSEEIKEIKGLCDLYYSNPPVSLGEIKNARLYTIYILDIDEGTVIETDPVDYTEKMEKHTW